MAKTLYIDGRKFDRPWSDVEVSPSGVLLVSNDGSVVEGYSAWRVFEISGA